MTSTEHLISIDSKIQEQDFLGSGEIHPVFVKNNHGIHYVIFYKNHWNHNKCEKLFQKQSADFSRTIPLNSEGSFYPNIRN